MAVGFPCGRWKEPSSPLELPMAHVMAAPFGPEESHDLAKPSETAVCERGNVRGNPQETVYDMSYGVGSSNLHWSKPNRADV